MGCLVFWAQTIESPTTNMNDNRINNLFIVTIVNSQISCRFSVSKLPSLFLGPKLLEISVVLLQERRRVEAVWTLLAAGIAVFAFLDEFHPFVPFLGEINLQRGTAQQKAHASAVVDFDAHRARLTVTATSAKFATQLCAVLLNLAP